MRNRDTQQKFLIDSCDVRGHVVQLDDTWQNALARTQYPAPVRQVLGEAFAAAALLASTIKFDGKLTLQVRGDGPVYLLVVQVTNDGSLRGLARWNAEPGDASLETLFGEDARMIVTVEAKRNAESYQGIVPLEGSTLADALQTYFKTSEQLPTRLFLAVTETAAAGMLIQKLPTEERLVNDSDGWQRAAVLCGTLTDEELCEDGSELLLHRLFHEEQPRVFDAQPMMFGCTCSDDRVRQSLSIYSAKDIAHMTTDDGIVTADCQFCSAHYDLDPATVGFEAETSDGA